MTSSHNITVAMFPNPYTNTEWAQAQHPLIRVLSEQLNAHGVECVHTPNFPGILWLLRNYRTIDVVHLHWPELHYARLAATVGIRGRINQLAKRVGLYGAMRALLIPWLIVFVHLCQALNVRLVWTVHDLYPHGQTKEEHYWADAVARRFLVNNADALGVNCPGALSVVTNEFGQPNHTFIAPLGNYRGFYADGITEDSARQRLGFAPEDRVMLCFGGIRLTRNPHQLAQIIHALPDPRVRLLIAGEPGGLGVNAVRQSLEEIAAIDPRIRCDFRVIPNDLVGVYFRACDWVVMPGIQQLTSAVVVLGLSYGRPIITPSFGCAVDMVGDAGFLYDQKSPTGLMDAVMQALKADFHEYRRRAEARAHQLDWSLSAIAMVRAYRAILNQTSDDKP